MEQVWWQHVVCKSETLLLSQPGASLKLEGKATHTAIHNHYATAVAVLGKNILGGAGPSSFGRQQRLSEIYYRTN